MGYEISFLHAKNMVLNSSDKATVYMCCANKVFGNRPSVGLEVINHFGGAKSLFNLSPKEMKSLSRIIPECKEISQELVEKTSRELEHLSRYNAVFISHNDTEYPAALKEITNYPIGIYVHSYCRLNKLLTEHKTIGAIGGKTPSSYGKNYCSKILSSNNKICIAGRLCEGIDRFIQMSSVTNDIPTIGVIPYGFRSEGRNIEGCDILWEKIVGSGNGAVITDVSPHEPLTLTNILRRDRILAGLIRALIVVESGKFDSCENVVNVSSSFGREIWTFPGPLGWKSYEYNNHLIQKNIGEIIISEDDLYEKIGRL